MNIEINLGLIVCVVILIVFIIATIVFNYRYQPHFDALAVEQDVQPSIQWKKSLYIKDKQVHHYYECVDGNYKIRYFAKRCLYFEIYTLENHRIIDATYFGESYYTKDMENPGLRKECLEEARRVIDIYENPIKNIG